MDFWKPEAPWTYPERYVNFTYKYFNAMGAHDLRFELGNPLIAVWPGSALVFWFLYLRVWAPLSRDLLSRGGDLRLPFGSRHPTQSHHRALLHGALCEKPWRVPFSAAVGTITASLLPVASAAHGRYFRNVNSICPPGRPNFVVIACETLLMS